MALATTNTADARKYSIGPTDQIVLNYTALSGDTTGTVTVASMSRIDSCSVTGGMRLTAAPTFSGNVITLAFTDPSTGGYFGTLVIHGR